MESTTSTKAATTAVAAATSATPATAASQRHCRRSQANGRDCQRDHRLAQHNQYPSKISLPTEHCLQVATAAWNRYRLPVTFTQLRASPGRLN
jgi:hypothetical protein